MKIRILSISQKNPSWVQEGFSEYVKRLPPSCTLELIEIPAEKRFSHSDIAKITEREGEKMLKLIKPSHYVIALDSRGKLWSSVELSEQMTTWKDEGLTVDLLIGGADGLSVACLNKANTRWSLSHLTFPHLLVRILIAEQIYRAWSILENHPYHR